MITKIISGGQTGADQGGLSAGRSLGIETGGFAPWNWMTDDGPQEELLRGFGLEPAPHDPRTYPKRTKMNVEAADATLWMGNPNSPGGRLTCSWTVRKAKKLLLMNPTEDYFLEWVLENNIQTLNVAGNRERTNPGINDRTYELMVATLS